MRILALDVGEKNIGLAISDELGWTAQGLPNLRVRTQGNCLHRKSRCGGEDIRAIADIVREKGVTEIVVGMPVNMDGSLGEKAKAAASFVKELRSQFNLSVKVWDERLTSLQAEKVMLEADLSRKKRKRKIDQLAAQLILQSYLDAREAAFNKE